MFGTATSGDKDNLAKHIALLESNAKTNSAHQIKFLDTVTELANHTSSRVDALAGEIDINHQTIVHLKSELAKWTDHVNCLTNSYQNRLANVSAQLDIQSQLNNRRSYVLAS